MASVTPADAPLPDKVAEPDFHFESMPALVAAFRDQAGGHPSVHHGFIEPPL